MCSSWYCSLWWDAQLTNCPVKLSANAGNIKRQCWLQTE